METPPSRVALDKQEKTLAYHLYANGPIKAVYAGQAFDMVAKILTQALPRRSSFNRQDASNLYNSLYEKGWVARVGKQIITEIRWIGPDPSSIEWVEPKHVEPSISKADLEKRLRFLYEHLGIDW